MLKKRALYFYRNGFNCSQCILKACEDLYKIAVSEQSIKMCSAVNKGFGIGGMCSVIIAGIMVFGLMFDENTAKSMRIKFISDIQREHKSINCSNLIKERKNGLRCEELICQIADLIENIINEYGE